jgi:ABC-type glycerol-3-phosphate transport system substrate-binding protein
MTRTRIAVVALVSAAALLAAGLAGAGTRSAGGAGGVKQNLAVSGSISFDGIWTAAEATAFGKVISAFNKVYPKVHVNYKPVGNNVPTVLATAIAGGHPPDMADIAQPGLIKQLAQQGHLKPITYAKSTIAANFAPAWQKLGSVNGKLYAVVFKAANKSLTSRTPASRRPRRGLSSRRRRRRSSPPARPRTRCAGRRAGRSPTCSRTSTSGRSDR